MSDGEKLGIIDPEKRTVRTLLVRFTNGFECAIFVTAGAAFSIPMIEAPTMNVWHYDVKGDKITLSHRSDSVHIPGKAHEFVRGWPVVKTESDLMKEAGELDYE